MRNVLYIVATLVALVLVTFGNVALYRLCRSEGLSMTYCLLR